MSKAGERILKSARAVRKKLALTRKAFAQRFGLSVDAVKEWEMARRKPERATRVLLKVIEREPEAVKRALEIAEPLRLNDPCL